MDWPWPEIGGGKIKRGADKHYPVMSMAEIIAMARDIPKIMLPDAHMYMWVTNNYLMKARDVIDAAGFTYVTCLTWEKERQGLGQYFRGTTEHVLFCKRGQPEYRTKPDGKRAQGRTGFQTLIPMMPLEEFIEIEGAWWVSPRERHSAKPPQIHEWAEIVSHGPYLEMFARTARAGWTAWGNEAPAEPSIEELLG